VRRLLRESSLTSPQRSNGLNANCWASRARNRQPVMGGRGRRHHRLPDPQRPGPGRTRPV